MTDDERIDAPICPWCGAELEMVRVQMDTPVGVMEVTLELECSDDGCDYSVSLIPHPVTTPPVAIVGVGRA